MARAHPDVVSLLPAHLDPAVHTVLLRPLSGLGNMVVTGSPAHSDMAWGFDAGTLVPTDSGGIHEEASSLGKPALAPRESTERPEAVSAGTVRFVGTDEEAIVRSVTILLSDTAEYDRMGRAVTRYGDGCGAGRCVQAIASLFGLSPPPELFVPNGALSAVLTGPA